MFLGQEVYYYMVQIAYCTELILQTCNYAQKQGICRENSKYALNENLCGHFRKAANFLQIMEGHRFCGVEEEPRGEVTFSRQLSIIALFRCSLCRLCRSSFRSCRTRCTSTTRRKEWPCFVRSLISPRCLVEDLVSWAAIEMIFVLTISSLC